MIQRNDGIVVLRVITREQQQLHYLALVIDNNGTATNTDTVLLADRVIVDNLSAKDGMITVNMRRFLPGILPVVRRELSPNNLRLILVLIN
jgi:hypothetical protein